MRTVTGPDHRGFPWGNDLDPLFISGAGLEEGGDFEGSQQMDLSLEIANLKVRIGPISVSPSDLHGSVDHFAESLKQFRRKTQTAVDRIEHAEPIRHSGDGGGMK